MKFSDIENKPRIDEGTLVLGKSQLKGFIMSAMDDYLDDYDFTADVSSKLLGMMGYSVKPNGNKFAIDKVKSHDVIESDDPCWKDYKQYGMKEKNGKQVPNCVKK